MQRVAANQWGGEQAEGEQASSGVLGARLRVGMSANQFTLYLRDMTLFKS